MWICIPVTGVIKSVVSVCLIIISIVMMAHSGMDCEGVDNCYRDNNINKCTSPTRRRRFNYRRLDATDEDEAKLNATWIPQDMFMGKEFTKVLRRLKAKGPVPVQGRRLSNDCYDTWNVDDCKKDNDAFRKESANWGATFMVIGIVSIMTGACNGAAGKFKQRRWMMIGMTFDILAMIVAAVLAALCYYIAFWLRVICDAIEAWAKEVETVNCWEDNADKVCEWAGMFFWGAVMLTILCAIYTTASILGCSATCCCPPKDAAWHPDNKQGAQGGAPTTIGTPVGQPVEGQPVESNENKA